MAIDILPYATKRQAEYWAAVQEHGSNRAAATALGVASSTINRSLKALAVKAAAKGVIDPDDDNQGKPPPGYRLGKRTVQRNVRTGEAERVWDRQHPEKEDLRSIAELITSELDVPLAAAVESPAESDQDLLVVLPIGDAHIGMLGWRGETGQDFDMAIAEQDLAQVSSALIDGAPEAGQCVIVNVGDFFHTDNHRGVTERGGNILDTDSRWPKMVTTGLRMMLSMIEKARWKFPTVHIFNAAGNHDERLSFILGLLLAEHYRDEPMVNVHTEPTPAHYLTFGKCLVGITHGDKCKPQALPELMATDMPAEWGQTEHRYWYTGHVHHDQRKEFRGCIFETFRTLAGKDAWHTQAGYRAGQDMKMIVLHKEFGEIARNTRGIR